MSITTVLRRLRAAMPVAAFPVATLALIIATVGGVSAYAGVKIGTAQIKNGAVTTAKLHGNSVTTAKIKNGQVTLSDINAKAKPINWIWHPGAPVHLTWDGTHKAKLVASYAISVPTTGLLTVHTFGGSLGSGATVENLVALVDYTGSVEDALTGGPSAAATLYDHMAAAVTTSDSVGQITLPQRVGPGTHTIKVWAISYSALNGETSDLGVRMLSAQFSPGVIGSEMPWTARQAPRTGRLLR